MPFDSGPETTLHPAIDLVASGLEQDDQSLVIATRRSAEPRGGLYERQFGAIDHTHRHPAGSDYIFVSISPCLAASVAVISP